MKSILDFQKKKEKGGKITMITCYDFTSAAILDKTEVDCLLVGDSAAMTMHGFDSTVPATMEMMVLHTAAVRRGTREKFIIADMPFLAYRKALNENIAAVQAIMQAGAQAVKIEGAAGNGELVHHLVDSGVPVMGHIGLTPQSVNAIGGYRVQGRTEADAHRLHEEALALQGAGCFALVLECVPSDVAADISRELSIPTIGIGAGKDTDGQVLVFQDLLGLNPAFKPKFVKAYMDGASLVSAAVNQYCHDVAGGVFPDADHSF